MGPAGNGLAPGRPNVDNGLGVGSTDRQGQDSPWLRQVGSRKVDQMGEGSSEPGPTVPGPTVPIGAGDGEVTQAFLGHPDTRPRLADPASPPLRSPTEVVRHGPGVPAPSSAGPAGPTVERMWRSSGPPAPPRRLRRLRRLLGSALTVILLAASGVVLYLRFHHAPFHVNGVVISQQTRTGCGVNVTGRITTNGSAGTVSYQWLFRPDRQPPQPLNQSVTAGQQAVYVTVAVEGSGHGSASRTVTLQVLGPDRWNTSTAVVVSC
jgi:hypothetical protein